MAPANPRVASSPATSWYFSRNSVWPSKIAQKPRGATFVAASQRPTRRRLPSPLVMNCVRKVRTPANASAGLRQNRPELHGQTHVAGHAKLALHKGCGRVELALRQLLESVQADADCTIGVLARAFRD